jgi:hypothetical protein
MKSIFLLPLVILLGCSPVPAQTPSTINAEGVPNTDLAGKKGDLSDKLNATDGVIRPQSDVDPAMRKPAPAEGSTPVIPPPGSPGGPQGVEP